MINVICDYYRQRFKDYFLSVLIVDEDVILDDANSLLAQLYPLSFGSNSDAQLSHTNVLSSHTSHPSKSHSV